MNGPGKNAGVFFVIILCRLYDNAPIALIVITLIGLDPGIFGKSILNTCGQIGNKLDVSSVDAIEYN